MNTAMRAVLVVAWSLAVAAALQACGSTCPPGFFLGPFGCAVTCADLPDGYACNPVARDGARDAPGRDSLTDSGMVVDVFDGGDVTSDVVLDVVEQPDGAMPDGDMDVVSVDSDAGDVGGDRTDVPDAQDTMPVFDPTLDPPRGIAPLSTSTVTSQRPTLRWVNGARPDGAVIEMSRTRDFARVERVERVTGDRVRPSSALSAGVWFWRMRARIGATEGTRVGPVWWFRVGARSAPIDTSWGSELDLNGDGYGDLAVGSPGAEMGRGRVDVFYGGPAGIGTTPNVTLRGTAAGDNFGGSVASAGDVNGDGYADLVVGASFASPGGRLRAGAAHVYFGSGSGVTATPARILEGVTVGDFFGSSVASIGDATGDGYAEVVVGAPFASSAGTASVFNGGDTGVSVTPSRVLTGSASGDQFGRSVAGAGDLDGDGLADLVVGAFLADPRARMDVGAASVFRGTAGGISGVSAIVLEGVGPGDRFGVSVAGAGDVNGDGFADLVVGAYFADPGGRTNAGSASVFHGSSGGISSVAARVLEGVDAFDSLGVSVGRAGDVDGDGFADLIVGAYLATPVGRLNGGTASVFHGGSGGVASVATRVLEAVAAADSFGVSVTSVGDVNGDGLADVCVGASGADPSGRMDAGSASVFHGAAGGVGSMPARVLEGAMAGDSFGTAIAR
jgi:hypothetical protein